MNLLDRIARSGGDPQRTIAALRVINECLERELSQYSACADNGPYQTGLAGHSHQVRNQRQAAHYDAVAEELSGYCGALEHRCEHLEETAKSTVTLLQVVMKDLESAYRKPMLSTVVARLEPIAALLETALANAPKPDTF